MLNLEHLIISYLTVTSVLCFNFDISSVKEIHFNGNEDTYFGYALLLQKGTQRNQATVIVGAPGRRLGGSVYSCSLNGTCDKYGIMASNANTPNGNFLGSVLDGGANYGDPFITCAPRAVRAQFQKNYLNGICYFNSNGTDHGDIGWEGILKPFESSYMVSSFEGVSYYDYAYAQAGFDVEYLKDYRMAILGAPGVKNWNGAFVTMDVDKLKNPKVIPTRDGPLSTELFAYFGYKVTTAKLGNSLWYVVGAPRGSNLFGTVRLYNPVGIILPTSLTSDEIGCYYGSALLAVDVNNDKSDDILVGAPMGAGSSWDEGYVYFYKWTNTKFSNPIKLVGGKKTGARFGSSITSIGDIDVDSYNDIAIAAPYENDGVGAVYIYMGSKNGIEQRFSQRLSPLDFPGNFRNCRGFGQGLAKGVDIDGNGHNDIAIGAYKSNQVFIMKTLSVIDYSLGLYPDVTILSKNDVNVTFCLYYSSRSTSQTFKVLPFTLQLELDYRAEGTHNFKYETNVTESSLHCQWLSFKLKPSTQDISPFKIGLKSELLEKRLAAKGQPYIEKSIPYSHKCGDDNICQTQVLLNAFSSVEHIILGLNKELTVTISADNTGEPGYNCYLHMNFSNVLDLRNTRDCNLDNNTYVCLFSKILETSEMEISFTFDIKLTKPNVKEVKFNFELRCLGENIPPGGNKNELVLDVQIQNSPYIQGSSSPENFYFTDDNLEKYIEVSHVFRIGNTGPSPIKLDVYLEVPVLKFAGDDIFEIDAKGSFNGIAVSCIPTNKTLKPQEPPNVSTLLTELVNKTIVIDCYQENVNCLVLFCDGNYIYKSTEIAEYEIKIVTKPKLLSLHYRNDLLKKDILAFISSAYIFNDTQRIQEYSSTMIFASKSKPIPLWIYILAGVLGLFLLSLLVFALYKCHFFDRNYRDKLNEEKLIEQKSDNCAERLDLVDLKDP